MHRNADDPEGFRRIAPGLEGAIEGAHHGHPDRTLRKKRAHVFRAQAADGASSQGARKEALASGS